MDLVTALGVLRRRWMIFVICVAAGLGGGYEIAHHQQKQYSATSQVLILVPATSNLGEQLQGTQISENLVSTFAALVTSQAVENRVFQEFQNSGYTGSPGVLHAGLVSGTFLIDITATSPIPENAQHTADIGAAALLGIVATFQQGQPQPITGKIVSSAPLPTAPYKPRPALELTIGGILGLLVGLGLIAGIEALDRTVRTVAQADALIKAPLLGVVPKRQRKTLIVGAKREGPAGEPYRSLRTAIRFLDLDRPVRTILVTSPNANDGKTATAANLAMALALSGERVVLVDADLRRAGLSRALGVESSVGLTSLVLGNVAITDILQSYATNLLVVASGPLPPNPSEILGSQLVNGFLHDLAGMCDIVVIDAPPVVPVADAVALSVQVDATMIVLRHSTTLRAAAAVTRRRLDAVGAHVVGYVLNAVPRRETRDYYLTDRYGQYGPQPQSPAHDDSATV